MEEIYRELFGRGGEKGYLRTVIFWRRNEEEKKRGGRGDREGVPPVLKRNPLDYSSNQEGRKKKKSKTISIFLNS